MTLSHSLQQQLLKEQNECTLSWSTQDGAVAATIVSYIWDDGKLWMTSLEGAPRIKAIRRDNRVAVVITGKGSSVGMSRCLSVRGRCHIHTDQSVRDWFFPRFAQAVLPDSQKGASMMSSMMNSPENLVLEIVPEKVMGYDAHDMMMSANSV